MILHMKKLKKGSLKGSFVKLSEQERFLVVNKYLDVLNHIKIDFKGTSKEHSGSMSAPQVLMRLSSASLDYTAAPTTHSLDYLRDSIIDVIIFRREHGRRKFFMSVSNLVSIQLLSAGFDEQDVLLIRESIVKTVDKQNFISI
jgi:hypothetical protein